jgi:cytochrome b
MSLPTPSNAPSLAATRTVWSASVRLLHWTLASAMIMCFVTHENVGTVHEWAGYVALAAASLRVVLGLAASGYWRFSQFVRGAGATLAYAQSVWQHKERRYLGHNPLGGWMVLLMLADAIGAGLTGWLSTTDRFWGVAWMADLHGVLGEALPPLLLLHVAGAIFTSWRHRENLVAAMLHGRKRAAGPDDVA